MEEWVKIHPFPPSLSVAMLAPLAVLLSGWCDWLSGDSGNPLDRLSVMVGEAPRALLERNPISGKVPVKAWALNYPIKFR